MIILFMEKIKNGQESEMRKYWLAASVKVGPFVKRPSTAVDSQIIVADNFRVSAADSLADADAIGKIIFIFGENSHEVGAAKTLIVNG